MAKTRGEPPNRKKRAARKKFTPAARARATSKESAKRMREPGSVVEAGAASGAARIVGSLLKTGKLPKKGPKSSVKNYDPRRASKKKSKRDLQREKAFKAEIRKKLAKDREQPYPTGGSTPRPQASSRGPGSVQRRREYQAKRARSAKNVGIPYPYK